MLCYRDQIFCSFFKGCILESRCIMALTFEIFEDAARVGLPINQYVTKPDCFIPKNLLKKSNKTTYHQKESSK